MVYRLNTHKWHLIRTVFAIAGLMILASVIAGFYLHPGFFIVTGFIGAMQLFFAITGYCPMAILLHKLNIHEA